MQAVDAWSKAAQQSGGENPDAATLAQAVEDLLDKESSFAEQNAKRMNLVRQVFKRPGFDVIVNIVDLLITPIDSAVNRLLKRTSILRKLRQKNSDTTPATQETGEEYAEDRFRKWLQGELGEAIVLDFIQQLKSNELGSLCLSDDWASLSETCFQLVLFGISDIWRRFCRPVQTFPFVMFSLVDCASAEDFVAKWDEFRSIMQKCPKCVDAAFAAPLLQSVDFTTLSPEDRCLEVKKIQSMLRDVMVTCPMATDTVENLHGQHQSMLHGFRGLRKYTCTAAELSVLGALKTEHAHLKHVVGTHTLPPQKTIAAVTRNIFRGKRVRKGQFEKRSLSFRRTLNKAVSRKVRPLSGWNVFQREMLKTKQISQPEWTQEIRKLSAQWRALSIEEKQNYNLKARYEQGCRDELVKRPLWNQNQTGTDTQQPYMHANANAADSADHELGGDDGAGGIAHLATQDLEDIAGFLLPPTHEVTFNSRFLFFYSHPHPCHVT